MSTDKIVIKGARENNLKNISLELPRDRLIVITGVSGSGKSSLAFDTIFAEGQRRYMESLSSYARMFLGQMDKPEVDYIDGLSPAIAIDQRGASGNPRSTVGTVTEIYDYLRLLYARLGTPHCPECGRVITPQTIDQIVDLVLNKPEGSRYMILAPLVRGRKGQFQKLFREIAAKGFTRARIDGAVTRLDNEEPIELSRYAQHSIEIVVDRIAVRASARQRIAESLETAMNLADGTVLLAEVDGPEQLFSQHLACPDCGLSFNELAPRLFSFNSPFGACPECSGLGVISRIDAGRVIREPHLSLNEGVLAPWGKPVYSLRYHVREAWFWKQLEELSSQLPIDWSAPWDTLSPELQALILYGPKAEGIGSQAGSYEGAIPLLERYFRETNSDWARGEIGKYMVESTCSACGGSRLKPQACAVTFNELSLPDLTHRSVAQARAWFSRLSLSERQAFIGEQILKEIRSRLDFLHSVGLGYLSLDRVSGTLSGGESQRIRLATQIGSRLVGVLYILDEPSIGLHQRDNRRLLDTLCALRDLGNTLVVVEHDEETIKEADYVVDIGPGAGVLGGEVVAFGRPEELASFPRSLTGDYLARRRVIPVPTTRQAPGNKWLELQDCSCNNIRHLDVRFPLGVMTSVTGVSGSGKSTLVNELLYKGLNNVLQLTEERSGQNIILKGAEQIDKVVVVDQSPIGRTPRSNPATYTGLFDPIRQVFAKTQEAKLRGYDSGRFSFNLKSGRCEACQGQGILKIEMHFLSDVFVPCEVCHGKRYNRETLEVHYKGKNIADVLDMTVEEGCEFFENYTKISRKLKTLRDIGLGYVRLGQSATTLSGGEAQRVKLATELSRPATSRTLYLLDEPTTGLHFDDVAKLIGVLRRLVAGGNTVVVIEHNLDVIKSSDWIIDMGPEGGDGGGQLVAQGTPEQVAQCAQSWTGQYLKPLLAQD